MAWLLCLMLLAFLVCSIGLAHAEPDTTSSTNAGSSPASIDDRDDRDDGDNDSDDGDNDSDDGDNDSDDGDNDSDDGDNDSDDDRDDERDTPARGDVGDREERFYAGTAYEEVIATDGLDDAQVDAPAPASIEAASAVPTWAHGVDEREAALRKHTSWLGRVDVSITWRRALNESTAVQRDEVWLVGTWRL